MSISRLYLVMLLLLIATVSAPQAGPSLSIKADYPVTKITDNVYVIYGPLEAPNKANQGFINNPAFVLTSRGVVIIDPGSSVYVGEMVLKKIRMVTQDPVVAVFNTHSHGDHWLGNGAIKEAFPKAVIYAHPNMKARGEAGEGEIWLERFNRITNGAIKGTRPVVPDKTVDDGDILKFGETRFRIYHNGKAHTDNDLMIEMVGQRVMFTGDIVRSEYLGIVDDGTFKGNIAAIDIAMGTKAEIFVPGHGPGGGREVPMTYRNYFSTLYSKVKELYEKDLNDFEMKPKVTKALAAFKNWARFDNEVGRHVSLAYLEVESEAF